MSGLLSLLGAAGNGLLRGRTMAKQEEQRQRQEAEARELQAVQLALQGVFRGQAPQSPGIDLPDLTAAGGVPSQHLDTSGRYQQVGSYYLDQAQTPQGRQAAERAQAALAQRQAQDREQARYNQERATADTRFAAQEDQQERFHRDQLALERARIGGATPAQSRQDTAHEAEGLAFLGQGSDGRTPGFGRAFQNIRAQHPDWSPGRVAYYAKTGMPPAAKPSAGAGGGAAAGGQLQEGERKNAALLTMAEGAYGALESHAQPSAAGKVVGMIPGVGHALQGAIAPEQQALEQSAYQLADAYLRLVSGANLPESEVRGFSKAFVPQPGDSPQVQAQKAQSRKDLIHAIRIAAGRGGDLVPERVPQGSALGGASGGASGADVYAQWGITPPGGR